MSVTDEEMRAAIDRIARTPDGEVLYRYLQSILQELPRSFEAGALQAHVGRRTLAHDLMARMAEGLDASGRPGTDTPSERAVALARGKPVAVSRPRGIARRVPATDPFVDPDPAAP